MKEFLKFFNMKFFILDKNAVLNPSFSARQKKSKKHTYQLIDFFDISVDHSLFPFLHKNRPGIVDDKSVYEKIGSVIAKQVHQLGIFGKFVVR